MNRKEAKVKLGLAFDLIIQTSHPLEMKKWSRIVKISKKVENEYRALPFRYQTIVERLKEKGFLLIQQSWKRFIYQTNTNKLLN